MLYQYKNDDGKVFNLAPHNNFTIESENIFTTIVGQNGTGKSRLLESIIYELIEYEDANLNSLIEKRLKKYHTPVKLIVVSTSPFDKFPIYDEEQHEIPINYDYLGLKNLDSKSFSKSYLSKIIKSLIDSLDKNKDRIKKLSSILNYLGYINRLELEFVLDNDWKNIIENFDTTLHNVSDNNDEEAIFIFEKILENQPKKEIYTSLFYENFEYNKRFKYKINRIINLILEMMSLVTLPTLVIHNNLTLLDKNEFSKTSNFDIDEISLMLEIGIIKLQEVYLEKKDINQHLLISQASSGEQSVIMSMLGIASKIENGSLICIDEPEVCLHPAWQEKYIKFLMNTFKDYKGCHFLIATHSPQITSKLEDENCYVMSMDDGKLVSASTLNNKSIDFQLAHVFKSPGFKNEYLTRELISLITLISEGKGQEELHSTKIEEILALKDVIDDNDPVKELIKMVESVKKELS